MSSVTVLDLLLESLRPGALPSALLDGSIDIGGESIPLAGSPQLVANLTSAQRKVSDFLVSNPEDCAFLPAAAIAKRCHVSESTVVRFAVACGLSGYPQLQHVMQILLRDRLSISERVERAVIGQRDEHDVLHRVIGADIKSLEQTLVAVSPAEFQKAIKLLTKADRIFAVGLRTSASLASMFTTTLRYIGRDASVVDLGIGDYWERLTYLKSSDVLLAISFRSYTTWTQDIITFVNSKRVPIVLLTDSALAPPTKYAQATLVVHRAKGTIVESSTAPMSIINALAVAVAQADEKRSLQYLRSHEQLWRDRRLHQLM